MGHSFSIKNRKPLFRKIKIMSVEERLNLQAYLIEPLNKSDFEKIANQARH